MRTLALGAEKGRGVEKGRGRSFRERRVGKVEGGRGWDI
jgi:hypothetical protein